MHPITSLSQHPFAATVFSSRWIQETGTQETTPTADAQPTTSATDQIPPSADQPETAEVAAIGQPTAPPSADPAEHLFGINPLYYLALIPVLLVVLAFAWLRGRRRMPDTDRREARGQFKKAKRFRQQHETNARKPGQPGSEPGLDSMDGNDGLARDEEIRLDAQSEPAVNLDLDNLNFDESNKDLQATIGQTDAAEEPSATAASIKPGHGDKIEDFDFDGEDEEEFETMLNESNEPHSRRAQAGDDAEAPYDSQMQHEIPDLTAGSIDDSDEFDALFEETEEAVAESGELEDDSFDSQQSEFVPDLEAASMEDSDEFDAMFDDEHVSPTESKDPPHEVAAAVGSDDLDTSEPSGESEFNFDVAQQDDDELLFGENKEANFDRGSSEADKEDYSITATAVQNDAASGLKPDDNLSSSNSPATDSSVAEQHDFHAPVATAAVSSSSMVAGSSGKNKNIVSKISGWFKKKPKKKSSESAVAPTSDSTPESTMQRPASPTFESSVETDVPPAEGTTIEDPPLDFSGIEIEPSSPESSDDSTSENSSINFGPEEPALDNDSEEFDFSDEDLDIRMDDESAQTVSDVQMTIPEPGNLNPVDLTMSSDTESTTVSPDLDWNAEGVKTDPTDDSTSQFTSAVTVENDDFDMLKAIEGEGDESADDEDSEASEDAIPISHDDTVVMDLDLPNDFEDDIVDSGAAFVETQEIGSAGAIHSELDAQLKSELDQLRQELEDLRRQKQELQTSSEQLQSDKSRLEQQSAELADENASLVKSLESTRRELEQAHDDHTDTEQLRSTLEKLQQDHAELSETANELESKVGELQSKLAEQEQIATQARLNAENAASAPKPATAGLDDAVKQKFTKLYRAYEKERKLRKQSDVNLEQAEEQRDAVAAELRQRKKELEELSQQQVSSPDLQERVESLSRDLDEANSKREDAEKTAEQMQQQVARMEQQKLEQSSRLEDLQAKVDASQKENSETINSLQQQLERLTTRNHELEERAAKAEELESKLAESEVNGAKARQELEANVKELIVMLDQTRSDLETATQQRLAAENQSTESTKKMESQQAKIAELEKKSAESQALRDRIDELEQEIQSQKESRDSQLSKTEGDLQSARDQASKLQKELKAAHAEIAELKKKESETAVAAIPERQELRDQLRDQEKLIMQLETERHDAQEALENTLAKQVILSETSSTETRKKSLRPRRTVSPASEEGDDLTQIHGVGPAIERKLKRLGVKTLAQIASWDESDVQTIGEQIAFKERIERESWVQQAQSLINQK